MQPTQSLAPERWCEYLERVTEDLFNEPVSIEIVDSLMLLDDSSMPLDDSSVSAMLEAKRLALQGLTYDPRNDVFEVEAARGGPHVPSVLRHFVDHPSSIAVDGFAPTTIVVDGRDGARTVITIERSPAFSG